MNNDLVAAILDNECEPENPFVIELHCTQIFIYWTRIESGRWDGVIWIPGVYSYAITVGE